MKLNEIYDKLAALAKKEERPALLAVDGRCASGKTSFARAFAEGREVNVFHMDDFFLRPEQRTAERLAEPGGNIDRERFEAEVLLPLLRGRSFTYRPFRCHEMNFGDPVRVEPKAVNLIEGSYSCHPLLRAYYDRRLFLTIDPTEQERRILARNGAEAAEIFRTKWIPLEELYFSRCAVPECCEVCTAADLFSRQSIADFSQ